MKITRSQLSGLLIVVCTLLAFAAYFMIAGWQSDDLEIPNEKAVALAALEQKFTGPRYFQHTAADPVRAAEAGEVDIYITSASAVGQAQRVIEERHFSSETAAKLHRLIDKLTEPAPSRVFSERINLVRLNLALDLLK